MFTTAGIVLMVVVGLLLAALIIWGLRKNRRERDQKMYRMGYKTMTQHHERAMTLRDKWWQEKLTAAEKTIELLRQQSDQLATKLVNEMLASARK